MNKNQPQFKLLIVAALKPEWSFLNTLLKFKISENFPALFTTKDTDSVAVLQTGVGMDQAALAFDGFLSRHSTKTVLHIGTCGGLDPLLKPGDLFFSRAIKSESGEQLPCHLPQPLIDELTLNNIPHKLGTSLCAKSPLKTPDEKNHVYKRLGAHAVDMESFIIAKTCLTKNITYINSRGVFDSATESLCQMPNTHHINGDLSGAGLMLDLIKDPKLILKLPGFQKRLSLIHSRLKPVVQYFLQTQTTTT